MSCNLKDFFLALPMEQADYTQMNMKHPPPDIIQRYNLHEIVSIDWYVSKKTKKGIYGLKQASVLAYNKIIKNISPHAYVPCKYSTDLFQPKTSTFSTHDLI